MFVPGAGAATATATGDNVKFMYLSSRRKYADKKGTSHKGTQVMNTSAGIRSDFPIGKLLSKVKSNLHASIASKPFIELDIDTKDLEVVARIRRAIQPFLEWAICTIETHGGYHVIFKIDKEPRGRMYREFNSDKWVYAGTARDGRSIVKDYVDVRSDPSPPVPGTYQAGFPVKFLDDFWEV